MKLHLLEWQEILFYKLLVNLKHLDIGIVEET